MLFLYFCRLFEAKQDCNSRNYTVYNLYNIIIQVFNSFNPKYYIIMKDLKEQLKDL